MIVTLTVIILEWVRAHCGIYGNEIADRAALTAHKNIQSTRSHLSKEEILNAIDFKFAESWSRNWKTNVILTNKGKILSGLQNEIKNNSWFSLNSRKVESAITRLRIGHAGVGAHLHRFEMQDDPLCDRCLTAETIDHILLRCPKHGLQREKLWRALNALDSEFTLRNILCFGDFPRNTLIKQLNALATFLREIGIIGRL